MVRNNRRGNIILGNGLSAKIFAFYNREFQIIGPEGEQVDSPLFRNFLFLQNNVHNRKFLSDLEVVSGEQINFLIKQANVVFYDGEQYVSTADDATKRNIIEKKLTDTDGNRLDFTSKVFETGLRLSEEQGGLLSYIDVDFLDIRRVLDKVIHNQVLLRGMVTDIDINERRLGVSGIHSEADCCYDVCVSTIPADVFWKLSKVDKGVFRALDTSLLVGDEEKLDIPRIPFENAIAYFPQENYEFSKVVKRGNICCAEITGHSKMFDDAVVFKRTRLMRELRNIPPRNVIFLGRYAEWNPEVRIQDVIRRSCSKNIMHAIWYDQRDFSGNFFVFDENLATIQSNIKEMLLLMSNESYDLLNSINWKKHHEVAKKLDYEKIKEEWIDIYKYWLSIGINLGISFEDFVDIYVKKSEQLYDKFGVQRRR